MKRRTVHLVFAVTMLGIAAGCGGAGPATAGLTAGLINVDNAASGHQQPAQPPPPEPVERVDTGPGFDDVATFCQGHLRVFVTASDVQSSSGIAVALDEAGCP
jgi:hypothetical protein